MQVVGFTFIRNAIKYDYPIIEAIKSIIPLCNKIVVAVGNSDDNTREIIEKLNSAQVPVEIIDTVWNDSLREGGRVLAEETNKAFLAISKDADWALYIQGDEVLHEQYHRPLKEAMFMHKDNKQVEGLLFDYLHFYGSYDYVGESYRWYRKEIRVVRPRADIFSYKDAQGFRKKPNQKLKVKNAYATMYHYGWVKEPKAMQAKQENFNKYWHTDEAVQKMLHQAEEFDYSNVDALRKFEGTHPAVMQARIEAKNWKFQHDLSKNKFSKKEKFKRLVEKITGYRPGEYKNYKLI
ncbi:MAG: glycosyltransferase family 2 protein [Luteibaculaceae bacterium]